MADFIITDTLANEILNYLNTKPHGEVRRIFDQLAQIKPVPVPEGKKDVVIPVE
jgi:hypothetical protein